MRHLVWWWWSGGEGFFYKLYFLLFICCYKKNNWQCCMCLCIVISCIFLRVLRNWRGSACDICLWYWLENYVQWVGLWTWESVQQNMRWMCGSALFFLFLVLCVCCVSAIGSNMLWKKIGSWSFLYLWYNFRADSL